MNTSTEISVSGVRLKLAGRFDMDTHHIFRSAYRKLLADCTQKEMVVDMADVSYLDSSALGMLLLLREDAAEKNINVRVDHCPPAIAEVLRTAHFDRLFAIST